MWIHANGSKNNMISCFKISGDTATLTLLGVKRAVSELTTQDINILDP